MMYGICLNITPWDIGSLLVSIRQKQIQWYFYEEEWTFDSRIHCPISFGVQNFFAELPALFGALPPPTPFAVKKFLTVEQFLHPWVML